MRNYTPNPATDCTYDLGTEGTATVMAVSVREWRKRIEYQGRVGTCLFFRLPNPVERDVFLLRLQASASAAGYHLQWVNPQLMGGTVVKAERGRVRMSL